jgi:O-methyltransferase involved in polyketide biosynthesis
MDARPFRSSFPVGLRWIEVDAPKIVALKNERLPVAGSRCPLERVALDLGDGGARRQFLRSLSGDHVLVLTEGVIGYLEHDDVAELDRFLRGDSLIDCLVSRPGCFTELAAWPSRRKRARMSSCTESSA